MQNSFDPYLKWLGIPLKEQPPNHYRLLGIPEYIDDPDVIENAADQRMAHIRNFQSGPRAAQSEKILNEIAAAKVVLLSPAKKAEYDANLRSDGRYRPPARKSLPVAAPLTSAELPASTSEIKPIVGPTVSLSTGKSLKQKQRQQKNLLIASMIGAGVALLSLLVISTAIFQFKEDSSAGTGGNNEAASAVAVGSATSGTRRQEEVSQNDPPVAVTSTEPSEPTGAEPDSPPSKGAVDESSNNSSAASPRKSTTIEEDTTPTRAATPTEDEQETATREMMSVFGEQLTRAETDAQKRAVTEEMIEVGDKTEDLAIRYVLHQHVIKIAKSICDVSMALRAAKGLEDHFQGDALRLRAVILSDIAKQIPKDEKQIALVPYFESILKQAVVEERFDIAVPLAEVALASAADSTSIDLRREALSHKREIEELAEAYRRYQSALQILNDEPNEPESNLVVGKYLCLIRGKWDEGKPYLSRGSNESMAKLSNLDDSKPENLLPLADGWWDVSTELAGRESFSAKSQALHFYEAAMPTLDGFAKSRVAGRLTELGDLRQGFAYLKPRSNTEAEARKATRAALNWLCQQQRKDGSWAYFSQPNAGTLDTPRAATAMSLLPLLEVRDKYEFGYHDEHIRKGLLFLINGMRVGTNGGDLTEQGASMYGHGMGTLALCKAYRNTRNVNLKPAAQAAVDFVIYAQDPKGGGWRYKPRQAGDTSVFGWQLSALKTASDAELKVPRKTVVLANQFLNSVQSQDGSGYGYTGREAKPTTTAIGLLCRIRLGVNPNDPSLEKGIAAIAVGGPSQIDPYYNYYGTLLMREVGGSEWQRWRLSLQRHLIASQEKSGEAMTSWYFVGTHLSERAGRLGCTALTLRAMQATFDD